MSFPACSPRLHPRSPPWRTRLAGMLAALAASAGAGFGVAAETARESAADAATRTLLDQLEERKMPDVVMWVLDRVAADPAASADLKAEVSFRRALAHVALSRTEADSKKRAEAFDKAQEQIDQFLKAMPGGRRAIDAYTQKGNLLVERGRMRLEQAKRPGADAAALRKEAVGFFDQAIKALEGKVKPGEEIKQVDNAEDAVLKEWRDARAKLAELKPKEPANDGDDKDPKKNPKKDQDKKDSKKAERRDPALEKELERLEADVETLQGKLLQTRLMVANAYFEKSKAFEEKSAEWTKALEESTKQFKELADKYPTLAFGVLARYYEGRNLAVLGKREQALGTLAALITLEDRSPAGVFLRAKALTTSIECWLAEKKFDAFDQKMREFALDERNLLRLLTEPDRLTFKYRAAEMLKAQAEALPPKEAPKGKSLLSDARRLATDVARINRDFADEARALVQSLGKDVVGAAEEDFAGILADAKVMLTALQGKQAEAKQLQSDGKDSTAAVAAVAAARDEALAKFDEAIARAAEPPAKGQEAAPEQAVNYARYMRTYLLFDAKRYAEAADQGAMLVDQFPNAMGSRQAGAIAMAALQQLSKGADAAAAQAAKERLLALARGIATIWPTEKEGSEALGILVNAAIDSKNPQAIIEFVDSLPATAGGRAAIVGRAGTALWREVIEQGRGERAGGATPEKIAGWKGKARAYLDEALKTSPGDDKTARRGAAAAGLSRAQIALDEGDAQAAVTILETPGHGPWTVVNDPGAEPLLREGSFAETSLTVALRAFIQADQLDKAQQAMDRLEQIAAAGGDDKASERLTAMYLSMGRELQEQLERLGGGSDADARQRAVSILGGFEKFLDSLAKRDPRPQSQIWVATTYLTLGSGKGTGAVVPRAKAEQYLDRAAAVYKQLLEKKDDPAVTKFEPSIRLKMASIFRERGKWDDAQEQIDWILSDSKRQNSLETQVQAAEILQATGQALAATDAAAAEMKFREATAGRTGGPVVVWGWGGIANKIGRQAFAGNDDKALKSRDLFFTARLNQAACLFARSQLPGKAPDQAKELLSKAEAAVTMTRKMYPDLGGPAAQTRFEKLLKEIQKAQGSANPRGFLELDEKAAAESPATAAAQ